MFPFLLFGVLLTLIALIPPFLLGGDGDQDLPGLGVAIFSMLFISFFPSLFHIFSFITFTLDLRYESPR